MRANLPGSVRGETSDGQAESGTSGPRVGSVRHGIVARTRAASELYGDALALHVHAIYANSKGWRLGCVSRLVWRI